MPPPWQAISTERVFCDQHVRNGNWQNVADTARGAVVGCHVDHTRVSCTARRRSGGFRSLPVLLMASMSTQTSSGAGGRTSPPNFEGRAHVAVIHNRYREPGGEDGAVAADIDLLAARGHVVSHLSTTNHALSALGPLGSASKTVWNAGARRTVAALLIRARPGIAHFHNTFPLLSPAVYSAAHDAGVPVVQTLHNYRLLCPNALLFRDGAPCEDCVSRRVKWPGVAHMCYRGSRGASAATAAMLALHSAAGTWERAVDVYIALTEFARRKFVDGGLPADRVVVRPNFIADDPGPGRHGGGYALFVGRLSPEKGVDTLLDAWRRVGRHVPLKVVGAGPLAGHLAADVAGVEFLGPLPRERVLALMHDAACLVFPSACYENFPLVLAEAFATGLPVVASGHGAAAEIVTEGRTGHHFAPGDADALAGAVERAFARPGELAAMGEAARREYETHYTPDLAYERLMAIYDRAVTRAADRR